MQARWVALGLFGVAAILRLHNAWVAPPLAGFDGPFHAAYVGSFHFDGRWPLPDEGWSTFHPPLYYALCALLWRTLPDGLEPGAVLFALRLLNTAAGLGIGFAAFACARRLRPDRPRVALYAAATALSLPMLVGPAAYLGNELFAAGLCAAALWLLLHWLSEPGVGRAVALGAVAGLAVLAKVSALVVLATAGVIACVRGIQLSGWRPAALVSPVVIGLVAVLVSGGYFARNVATVGEPIVLQTDLVSRAMKRQGYGPRRPLREYVSPRADVLLDVRTRSPETMKAVWPGTFASIWFDLHGTTLHVASSRSVTSARILYLFGGVITGFGLVGFLLLARRRLRVCVPLGAAAVLLLALFNLAAYIAFTHRVATASALKGTYLSPAVVPFALLVGIGCDWGVRRARALAVVLPALFASFVLVVTAVFWMGWLSPLRMNPAALYLKAYRDAPTLRVYEYFIGPPPAGAVPASPTPPIVRPSADPPRDRPLR